MTGHTPGPWREDFGDIVGRAFDGSWKIIAQNIRGGNTEQREANARLIAAAPDMLAALHIALHDYTLNDSAFRVVEAAIAKATGAATP